MGQPVDGFRGLFESICLGVAYLDEGGRLIEANPAALDILGLDLDELRRLDASDSRQDCLREDGSPFPRAEQPAMRALATGEPVRGVVMGFPRPREGKITWISIDAIPEFRPGESRPWRVCSTFSDISGRKEAERDKELSEDRFRRLFSEMPLGFSLNEVIRDGAGRVVDYRILDANPAFERFTGMVADAIRGRRVLEILPNLEAEWMSRFASVVDTGLTVEFESSSGDLQRRYLVRAYRNAPEQFVVVFADVTALSRAEEEVRKLLAEKEQLLMEVHHRIKNSMATITGLLSLQASFQSGDEAAAALEGARNRVATMQRVYESLFRSPDFRNVPVKDFLDGVLSDATAPYVGSLDGPIAVDSSFIDSNLDAKSLFPLGIIVYELVTNACKYGFPEGRHGKVGVRLETRGDGGWLLSVDDDGVGLPPGVDPARPQAFGLTLVKALTEQLGGKVTLEAGPGTRYRIPIAPPKIS